MDPVSLIIGAMVLSGVITKLIQDGRTDRAYAKQGIISPRHQERLARLEQAGYQPSRRYGLRDYLRDLWCDAIEDLRAKRVAARVGRPEPLTYDTIPTPSPIPARKPRMPFRTRSLADKIEEKLDEFAERWKIRTLPADEVVVDPWDYAEEIQPAEEDPPQPEPLTAQPEPQPEEEPMTAPALDIPEVHTNADARRAADTIRQLAHQAAQALDNYSQHSQDLATLTARVAEQMEAAGHDRAATLAAATSHEVIAASDLISEYERLETVRGSAAQVVAELTPYQDAEELIQTNGTKAETLATTSN